MFLKSVRGTKSDASTHTHTQFGKFASIKQNLDLKDWSASQLHSSKQLPGALVYYLKKKTLLVCPCVCSYVHVHVCTCGCVYLYACECVRKQRGGGVGGGGGGGLNPHSCSSNQTWLVY